MILVDTNVWSELTRAEPAPSVQAWERAHAAELWLSTVVLGELLSGAHLLPEGRRRQQFLVGYEQMIEVYADRVVDFDIPAARRYGEVLAQQERAGRNPGTADTQIAATALTRGMALATRNTKHFEGIGLTLIDPWQH
ncbi:MAG: type II toxin-antitoxin system VapC family toxin [Tsuneonella sp.]